METLTWTVFVFAVLIGIVLCYPLTSDRHVDVTYAELEALNISCYPSDTCQRNETDLGSNLQSCDCDSSCSIYGTCCVDSEFRSHKISPENISKFKCLSSYNNPGFEVFMVDSCRNDFTFESLCYSNPEESNDPFSIIPVTSNTTGITYKNYFCAVCNEEIDSEQLEFWDMQIWINGTLLKNFSEPQFKFNKTIGLWTVNDGGSSETSNDVPVTLKIQKNLQVAVKPCSVDLIETCPRNWADDDTALKCKSYMAAVFAFPNVRYKNPHCAICNFENLSNLQCLSSLFPIAPVSGFAKPSAFAPASAVGVENPLIRLFVLVDREKRCEKNMVYDKFADKCRCNSRIYTKKNGKCVHKI